MQISFTKMNGAGNDFILIDNRPGTIVLSEEAIRWLCDRRRGVGADGVLIVESDPAADFRMRYHNADGGEAEMCGNGARCMAMYARGLGLGRVDGGTTHLRFSTRPGVLEARVDGRHIEIAMTDATSLKRMGSVAVADGEEKVHFINTGVPHAVVVEADVTALSDDDITRRGRAIRTSRAFAPHGANVDFVSVRDDGAVMIRTYERGVEAETLACGTGAVAGAVVMTHLGHAKAPVRMVTRGGETLTITFNPSTDGARQVILEGPAAVNFVGSVELATEGASDGL